MLWQLWNTLILTSALVVLVVIWAISLRAVFQDVRRRDLPQPEQLFWLALSLVLPLIGPVVYAGVLSAEKWALPPAPTGRLLPHPDPRRTGTATHLPSEKGAIETPTVGFTQVAVWDDPGSMVDYPATVAVDVRPGQNRNPPDQAAQSQVCQLLVVEGPETGILFIVNRLPALIGRDANATVRIQNDLALSRRHAMLFAQHEELWIRDLDSRHGTAINGVQLHEQPLKSGDRITLGSTVLALQSLSRIPA